MKLNKTHLFEILKYGPMLMILLLSITVMGQMAEEEQFELYLGRCKESGPTVLPLPNNKGYIFANSDSTFVQFPQGRLFKIGAKDLMTQRANQFNQYFHLADTLYFTHNGAGVVFSFDGNSLKRIDESFYHHNQYGALPFVYKESFYLFGGSGLFMRKNFVTKFDRVAREWLLQETTGQKPDFTHNAAGMVVGDYYYIMGERFFHKDQLENEIEKTIKKEFLVYRLDLNSWHWDLLGAVSSELNELLFNVQNRNQYLMPDGLFINGPRGLFKVNFVKNEITRYENSYPLNNSRFYPGDDPDHYRYVYCDSRQFMKVGLISNHELENLKVSKVRLYRANLSVYYNTLLQVIGLLLFVALILILINELKFERRVVIRLKGGVMLYRSRVIRVFDQHEQMVLLSLAHEGQISFSAIEDVVSYKNDSQSVRVKKRDRCLRILNEKIATIFNHNESERDDYFIIQSGSDDKRSRSLSLNPEFFKVM